MIKMKKIDTKTVGPYKKGDVYIINQIFYKLEKDYQEELDKTFEEFIKNPKSFFDLVKVKIKNEEGEVTGTVSAEDAKEEILSSDPDAEVYLLIDLIDLSILDDVAKQLGKVLKENGWNSGIRLLKE